LLLEAVVEAVLLLQEVMEAVVQEVCVILTHIQ
jgi:hypothetical protein